jgi:hypothetical protein
MHSITTPPVGDKPTKAQTHTLRRLALLDQLLRRTRLRAAVWAVLRAESIRRPR